MGKKNKSKPVHEEVAELLAKWNPPPVDGGLVRLIGVPTEEGDTRATASVRPEEMNHPGNAAADDIDAERMLQDDGDDEEDVGYDDMTNADLKELLKARELPVSGNHDELVARLDADDAEGNDDEEDDDEDE